MALTLASTSSSASQTTRTQLTHIDALITDASSKGMFSIVVDPTIIDDTMIAAIKVGGYKIYPLSDSMGTHTLYRISW